MSIEIEDLGEAKNIKLEELEEMQEDEEISVYYIDEEKQKLKELDRRDYVASYLDEALNKTGERFKSIEHSLENGGYVEKSFEGSNQSTSELDGSTIQFYKSLEKKIATLPYNPQDLAKLVEINSIHKSACEIKARDSVGRDYKIKPKYPIMKDNSQMSQHGNFTNQDDFDKDCKILQDFLDNCNKTHTFQQISYLVSYDREMIGWGAYEVIRSLDGKVSRLIRVPAERIRVLEGFEGFLELNISKTNFENKEVYTYYQPFGEKVKAIELDPFDTSDEPGEIKVDYNPEKHGPLDFADPNNKLSWNLVSKTTGEPIESTAENFMNNAANEIVFIPKDHPNTIYYGYSDVIACRKAIKTICNIESYIEQFFENNCVPRYAVVITGQKISEKLSQEIAGYFSKNIKGNVGKTLVFSVPSGAGKMNTKVEFQRLDTEQKEADFLETKKTYYQDIIQAHQVPPALLQIHEAAGLGSGRGTAQAEMYKDRFVVPTQRLWAQKLNKMFKFGLGIQHAEIEFDPLDVKDARVVAEIINLLLIQGVLTINDARRELGLDPVKNGDIPVLRVREGSLIRVDQLHLIESKLQSEDFQVSSNEDGEEFVDVDSLVEEEDE